MEKEKNTGQKPEEDEGEEEAEGLEFILFQVSECYVYLIPPRISAASYRADEWDVNKWAWQGALKVISKGEECIIRLEDKATGELYARAFLRDGEPHPVEPVIDSSRYFVLRIEENIGGRLRHAFVGIGFRERPEAYDFQAALHDHMKYLNKKKTAEEMEQQFHNTSSVDYSLKEGETIVLQIKNKVGSGGIKSKFFEQGLNNLSLEEKGNQKECPVLLKPPPPPPTPIATAENSPTGSPQKLSLDQSSAARTIECQSGTPETESIKPPVVEDDDFGDFQAAG